MSICMFLSRWLWSKLYLTTVPSTVVMAARHLVRVFLEHCHRTRNPTSLALVNRHPPAISITVPRFVQISMTEIYIRINTLKASYTLFIKTVYYITVDLYFHTSLVSHHLQHFLGVFMNFITEFHYTKIYQLIDLLAGYPNEITT